MNKFAHIELNEKELADRTLDYILNNQHSCLESSLFLDILDPRINYGDLNKHVEFLKERLSHLEFIIDYDTVEFENKMDHYQVLGVDDLGRTIDNSGILAPITFEKEKFSKEIFWANEEEEKIYRKISDFICFEDKIVPENKLYNVLINAPFFNVKDWILYYQKLLDLKFPEFSEEIISGKTIIKYRPSKDNYFLGIETDYQFCKRHFKKGDWEAPEYKLIIFKKIEKKKISKIVTFEKFIHPHFDPPAYSFGSYFYAENLIRVSEIENSLKYFVEKEFIADGNVRLSMSEEFGEHLKRHAYFYYEMLYQTTKEYIKFIEDSFEY